MQGWPGISPSNRQSRHLLWASLAREEKEASLDKEMKFQGLSICVFG